ncbi:hypothetical protein ACJZ2D_002524 [Fusarium nematophilum]
MQRSDSGYESNTPPRRASTSNSRPSVARRSSNSSSKDGSGGSGSGGGVRARFRNRPSLRRAAKTNPVQTARTSNQSLHLVRSSTAPQHQQQQQQQHPQPKPAAFFHFPSPDPAQLADPPPSAARDAAPTPVPSPPPQTTHYWTSDRTRRLEYAAIDAATRGVKGWVMKHLVPDCFLSRENKHLSFDDDSGSVRRYRLELEDDHVEKGAAGGGAGGGWTLRRRKGWRFWRRRKVEAQPAAFV